MLKSKFCKSILVLCLLLGTIFLFSISSEKNLVFEESYNYTDFISGDLAFENKTIENLGILKNVSESNLIKVSDSNSNKSINENISLDLDISLEVKKILVEKPEKEISVIVRNKKDKKKLQEVSVDLDSVEEIVSDDVEILPNREYYMLLDSSVDVLNTESFWNSGFNGTGIKVAVLDTGIETNHPFLSSNVILSKSFVGGDSQDNNGHGTHVAGIIVGNSENFKGVASGVKILNGKVLADNGAGSSKSIADGIYWAADNNVNVISMSLGAPFTSQDIVINDAIDYAIEKGVIVVVASGNCGSGLCGGFTGVTVPGSYEKVITVGAVDDNLNYVGFSSGQDFGSYIKPDVVAPGVNIKSSVLDGSFGVKSGTSMATPHIAGLVALILEKNSSLTHNQVKYLLENNVDDLGARGKDVKFGSGFVDVDKLLLFDVVNDVNDNVLVESENELTDRGLIEKNIGDFKFLKVKNLENDSNKHFLSVFEKNNELIFVENYLFNVAELREYLFKNIPIENESLVQFVNFENSYFVFDNKYYWYNDNNLYLVHIMNSSFDYSLLLDGYSEITGNIVGETFIDNLEILKEMDNRVLDYYSSKAISSLNSTQLQEVNNFSVMEGGDVRSDAKEIEFGTIETEAFMSSGENNWYRTTTTNGGDLYFEIHDIDEGSDFTLYLYDYEGKFLGFSDTFGNSDEQVIYTKSNYANWGFYLNAYARNINGISEVVSLKTYSNPCSEIPLNSYRCVGDTREKLYQNIVCGEEWRFNYDCNEFDNQTNWINYCSDNSVYKKRIVNDYGCVDTSCKLKSSNNEVEKVEDCSSNQICYSGACVENKAIYVIEKIDNVNPSSAKEDDIVEFAAKVRNIGNKAEAIYIEGAVVPEHWKGKLYGNNDYNDQSVSEIGEVCAGNKFYDRKYLILEPDDYEYVYFTVKAPNRDDENACYDGGNYNKSAWDVNDEFNIIIGTFNQAGEDYKSLKSIGYDLSLRDDIEICNALDGSSEKCSCSSDSHCNSGFICDIDIGYGACVEDSCVFPFNDPKCPCDSHPQCGEGYFCDFNDTTSARCKSIVPEDQCNTVDTYSCLNGNVHRCEYKGQNDTRYKELMLTDTCLYNEVCDNLTVNQDKQCIPTNGYDMQIEKSSSGTLVYKQAGDTLVVNLKLDNQVNSPLIYDSQSFELLTSDCSGSTFSAGEYECEFKVLKGAKEINRFRFAKDIQTVKIIDNPHSIYVTNIEKLYDRYKDDASVNVLLEKTYQKAGKTRGIVYDLGREVAINHPYLNFYAYDRDLKATYIYGNEYVLEAAKFVHNKCGQCKETIIVGDDYVVPSYVNSVNLDKGLFSVNSFEDGKNNYYSDSQLINKVYDKDFTQLDDGILSFGENFDGKEITIIYPKDFVITQNYTNFRNKLQENFNPVIREFYSNEISVNDFWELRGETVIIIGDYSNNKFIELYTGLNNVGNLSQIQLDRSQWDKEESAILLFGENSEQSLEGFTFVLRDNNWNELRTQNLYYTSQVLSSTSWVLTILEVGSLALTPASGGGTAIPAIIFDYSADTIETINDCGIVQDDTMCAISTASLGIPIIGAKFVKIGYHGLEKVVGEEVLEILYKKYKENFLGFLGKIASKGQSELVGNVLKASGKYSDDAYEHLQKYDYTDEELKILKELLEKYDGNNIFNNIIIPRENVLRVYFSKESKIILDNNKEILSGIVLRQGKAANYGKAHIIKRHIGVNSRATPFRYSNGRYLDEDQVFKLISEEIGNAKYFGEKTSLSGNINILLTTNVEGYSEDVMTFVINKENGNLVTSHLGLPEVD